MGVSFYLPRQTTQVQTDWYWNASHKTQWSPTGVTTATCSLKTRHESLGLLNQAWESRSLGRILNLRLPSRNVWLRQRTDQRDQRDRAVSVESDTHWENAQFNIENLCINHCLKSASRTTLCILIWADTGNRQGQTCAIESDFFFCHNLVYKVFLTSSPVRGGLYLYHDIFFLLATFTQSLGSRGKQVRGHVLQA